jgi:hypothetical protein
MTLIDNTVSRATSTPTAPAAPTSTTETIASPGPGVFLRVVAGATTTTVTVVRPGSFDSGVAKADDAYASLINTRRDIYIGREFKDTATGLATVTFSQLTNVTAEVVRFGGV